MLQAASDRFNQKHMSSIEDKIPSAELEVLKPKKQGHDGSLAIPVSDRS